MSKDFHPRAEHVYRPSYRGFYRTELVTVIGDEASSAGFSLHDVY